MRCCTSTTSSSLMALDASATCASATPACQRAQLRPTRLRCRADDSAAMPPRSKASRPVATRSLSRLTPMLWLRGEV